MRGLACRVLLLLVAVFAWASRSDAAAINIIVEESSPFSGTWNLRLDTPSTSIGGLALLVSDVLVQFTATDPRVHYEPPICPLGCGEPPGFEPFFVSFAPQVAFTNAQLGFFTASNPIPIPSILPGDDLFGATLFDGNGNAISPTDYAITVIGVVREPGQLPGPEPETIALIALAVLGVGVIRTRAGDRGESRGRVRG